MAEDFLTVVLDTQSHNMLSRRLLRIKVFKSLYSHHISQRPSLDTSLREYRTSVAASYNLYLLLLELPEKLASYAESRIKIASEKLLPTEQDLSPNRKLVDNKLIAELRDWDELHIALKERKLSWGVDVQDTIRDIYDEMITTDSYKNYMKGSMSDRAYIEKFYEELFEDNEKFENLIEGMSIFWADDLNYALIQVIRTIKTTPLELLSQFKDDADRLYGEALLLNATRHMTQYLDLVNELSENWDLERIAISDRLLLVEAIAELVGCESIPTKVTMDEFIEISKYFSTPQSATFINGILHKAVERLTAQGQIAKTGRGLLD